MNNINDSLNACREAYLILASSALENRCPAKGLSRRIFEMLSNLLGLRIALQRSLLSSSETKTAREVLSRTEIPWSALEEAMASFGARFSGATGRKESGRGVLWPLNEFIPEGDLSQALASFAAVDENVPVRILGDLYQNLQETPLPVGKTERQKKALRNRRRHKGMFFTPPKIIDRIVKLTSPRAQKGEKAPYVCDPAMGTGHFLVAAAWHLAGGDPASARHIAETRLFGVDLDASSVRLAAMTMWLEFSTPLLPFEVPAHFLHGDSLVGALWQSDEAERSARKRYGLEGFNWKDAFPKICKRGGFDCIIGNPPYDVLTGFGKRPELKLYTSYLRECEQYPLTSGGQLNLYRLFMERSLELLKKDGAFSFVVPGSFLTDKAVARLRREMLDTHHLSNLDYYPESARSFEGVGQAVTVFLSHKDKGATHSIAMKKIDRDGKAEDFKIKPDAARALDAEFVPLPMAQSWEWDLCQWLAQNADISFSEIADGAVGEVDQTFFARHMRDDEGAPFMRGCHVSAFGADLSMEPSRQRFLDRDGFLEQKGTAAEACEQKVNCERIAQLGIRNMESRPRFVACRVPSGTYLGNSVNYWLPKAGVPTALVLGLLNSVLYDWRFRLTSSNNNINIYEVRSLPLPKGLLGIFSKDSSKEQPENSKRLILAVEAIACAVEELEKISDDDKFAQAKKVLDSAVFDLFGLPEKFRDAINAEQRG